MDVRSVLQRYHDGGIDLDEAERLLRLDHLRRVGEHTVFDMARALRRGIPEVVYGRTKSPEMLREIVAALREDDNIVVVSRASEAQYQALCEMDGPMEHGSQSGTIIIGKPPEGRGSIGIITAGTSDIPVADEARMVARAMGCDALCRYDVGVAAIHRILGPIQDMIEAGVDAIVVVAGMEGALPTVVSSLSSVPVIGVPTSTGYGHGGGGEGALMSMLQTCSPGLVVVNIDNGIGAGTTAALISRRARR